MPKCPCAKMSPCRKSLCQKVLVPKRPQRRNVHVLVCPQGWNMHVPKCPGDEMSMPKCLLPKCQVPKWWEAKFLQPNRNRFCQHLNSSGENFLNVFSKWNFFNMIFPKNKPVLFNGLGQTDMAGGLPSQAQKWKMLADPCTAAKLEKQDSQCNLVSCI